MAAQDENIQLDSEFTYQQYAPPIIPQNVNISGMPPGGVVTNIDGDAGAGASGPVVTFSGGATGFGFTAVGTSVTLTGSATPSGVLPIANGGTSASTVAGALAALGLSKNNVAAAAPAVTDDAAAGYSINSLWTDTTGPTSYICQDATNGAAVWHAIP